MPKSAGHLNNEPRDIQQFVGGKSVPLTNGPIALQLEFAQLYYRNLEIQELAQ